MYGCVAGRGVAATAAITLEFVAITLVVHGLQKLVQFVNGLSEQRVQQMQVLKNNIYENIYEMRKLIRGQMRNKTLQELSDWMILVHVYDTGQTVSIGNCALVRVAIPSAKFCDAALAPPEVS